MRPIKLGSKGKQTDEGNQKASLFSTLLLLEGGRSAWDEPVVSAVLLSSKGADGGQPCLEEMC